MAYDFRAENEKETARQRKIKRALERGGLVRVELAPTFEEFWEEDGPTYELRIETPKPRAIGSINFEDERLLYVVTPSAKEPRRYQITWFFKSTMEPWGDTQRDTWPEAIMYALQERAMPKSVTAAPRRNQVRKGPNASPSPNLRDALRGRKP